MAVPFRAESFLTPRRGTHRQKTPRLKTAHYIFVEKPHRVITLLHFRHEYAHMRKEIYMGILDSRLPHVCSQMPLPVARRSDRVEA